MSEQHQSPSCGQCTSETFAARFYLDPSGLTSEFPPV